MKKACSRCIMDNINDPNLILDHNGICNHFHNFDRTFAKLPSKETAEVELLKLTEKIVEEGKERKYDCMIGVSGGVDSTYLAYVAKQGLACAL